MSDKYYIELARESLNKADRELRHAEQYLIKAGLVGSPDQISKLIRMTQTRNGELGEYLKVTQEGE